ncbi:hypothetical protein Q3G72_033920 [Acer saccharum]|nr:hypothetical protein Q3G72_033920 [Acer saccharum]
MQTDPLQIMEVRRERDDGDENGYGVCLCYQLPNIHKFLQSQSIVQVLTIITMAALAFHALLNWLLITKPNQGLVGAAIALL